MKRSEIKQMLRDAGFEGRIHFRSHREFGKPDNFGPAIHRRWIDPNYEVQEIMHSVERDLFDTVVLYLEPAMSKLIESRTKGYDVFKNGRFLGFVAGQNKKIRKETVRQLVTHTHMGEWIRTNDGIEYGTTTGVYLLFQPCKRLSQTLANYRIEGLCL